MAKPTKTVVEKRYHKILNEHGFQNQDKSLKWRLKDLIDTYDKMHTQILRLQSDAAQSELKGFIIGLGVGAVGVGTVWVIIALLLA